MTRQNMSPFWVRISTSVLLTLMIARVGADSLYQTYCSTQNTGTDYAAVTNIYNSDGSCHDLCLSSYAFAVVQWQQCWCSNYIPASQVSTDLCDQPCPGFQTDLCGNKTAGLFGYIQLSVQPSGTAGVSSTSSTKAPTSTSNSASSSTTSTTSLTPSIQVVTISGATVTQYITPTPAPSSEGNTIPNREQQNKGLSGGAIAGIVIGVLAGIALVILAVFLLLRRRRQADDDTGAAAAATGRQPMSKIPGRNISVLSKAGLVGRGRPATANEDGYAQQGSNSARHSMMLGGGNEVSPVSPLGGSGDESDGRRHSRPFVYDQRLNPSALFPNQDAAGSRVSMQDTQDYSRTLNIANPDPRASFDSRVDHHY